MARRTYAKRPRNPKRRRVGSVRRRRALVRSRPGTRIMSNYGLPGRATFRHRYVEALNVTTQASLPWQYRFSVNGMYDPNNSGGGPQPYYCTSLCPL